MTELCSVWSREHDLDPIGTAGSYKGYIFVEWPLPWPRDLLDLPEFQHLRPFLAASGLRFQGLVPDSTRSANIIVYRATEPFRGFTRVETNWGCAPSSSALVAVLAELFDAARGGSAAQSPHDVYVCTHGKRDRCCGSFGTALALELGSADIAAVRIGRTSHTGGHRFAPTAVMFPEGTSWAFTDVDLLRRVIGREGPISGVLPHYRGCSGLSSPALQALERAVLGVYGWDLFDRRRWGWVGADGAAALHVSDGRGDIQSWNATVEISREFAVPACRSLAFAEIPTMERELAVRGLKRHMPSSNG